MSDPQAPPSLAPAPAPAPVTAPAPDASLLTAQPPPPHPQQPPQPGHTLPSPSTGQYYHPPPQQQQYPGYPPQPQQPGFPSGAPPPQGYPSPAPLGYPHPQQQSYAYPPGYVPAPYAGQPQPQYPPSPQQYGVPSPPHQVYPGYPGYPPQQHVNPYGQPVGFPPAPVMVLQYSAGYAPGPDGNLEYDPAQEAEPQFLKDALPQLRNSETFAGKTEVIAQYLSKFTPRQLNALHRPNLLRLVTPSFPNPHSILSLGLLALLRGPRDFDVELLHEACTNKVYRSGETTGMLRRPKSQHFWMLQVALLDRPSGDIAAIKAAYPGGNLHAHLESLLRDNNRHAFTLFANIVDGRPCKPGSNEVPSETRQAVRAEIEQEAKTLDLELGGKDAKPEPNRVIEVFTKSSAARLREVVEALETGWRERKKTSRKALTLQAQVKECFQDPLEDQLQYILAGAMGKRAERDSDLIEKTMEGAGTKNNELVVRVVKASWDKVYLTEVKTMYQKKYGKSLLQRIEKDCKGAQVNFLRQVVESNKYEGDRLGQLGL